MESAAAKTARKFRHTTDSNHDLPVAANLLERAFDPAAANEAWVSDFTFIPTREGWLYLAAVEDLFSRRVVGWSMNERMTSRLVVDALAMAVAFRLPERKGCWHSDRGSQYASEHYRRLLAKHGIECSMSRRAQLLGQRARWKAFCFAEKELVHHEDYQTRGGGRGEYIRVH